MKLKARLKQVNNNSLTFEISHNVELELDKDYTLNIEPYKSKRSLEQNNLLWGIIQQISDKTGNDLMDIYIDALKRAGAKVEILAILPKAEDALRKEFRAVKPIGKITTDDGIEMLQFFCFWGSSKMNTGEMTKLIECTLQIADECGVYPYA